ncbi:MAG: hypothetical protein ACTJE5_04240 [Pseudomonas helleri]
MEKKRLAYISEKLAIKVLSKNTGRSISLEDMAGYSELGVVPAYMKFAPKDKTLYPGKAFCAIHERGMLGKTLSDVTALDCLNQWKILPFPLPDNDVISTKDGIAYRIFAARSDGCYEAVSDQHFVKVYARNEMTLASKNVDDYESMRGLRPMAHSCGEQWEEQPPDPENWKDWFVSPFAESENVIHPKKRIRKDKSDSSDSANEKDMPCMRLIIAGMLELIRETRGSNYNNTKINNELRELMPQATYRGMSKESIERAFAAASRAKEDAKLEAGIQPKRTQKLTK